MVLNDRDIRDGIEFDDLVVIPHYAYDAHPEKYEPSIQPCSYDLTLSREFKRIQAHSCVFPNKSYVDLSDPIEYVSIPYEGGAFDGVVIGAGEFMLGVTNEVVNLPNNICGILEGRSSVGRAGLFIHNAGYIDAGFKGQIVLELFNAGPNPIRLIEGIRIAQIVFFQMTDASEIGYKGKYQNQMGVVGSRIHMDKEVKA